jgi:hypothetical protein
VSKTYIYRGWISGDKNDLEILQQLDIKIGPWEESVKAWTPCNVTPEALIRLDRMWGRFIWGLDVVEA